MQTSPLSQKQSQKQHLLIIPQTQPYKDNQQPILSVQKINSIKDKLLLQKTAIRNTKYRENDSDFYLKYNVNPFLEYQQKDKGVFHSFTKDKREPTINVVDKLYQMSKGEVVVKQSVKEKSRKLEEMKTQHELISNKIINLVQNNDKWTKAFNGLKEVQKSNKQENSSKSSVNFTEAFPKSKEAKQYMNVELEQIVSIKEQNFFNKNKKTNIFKVIRADAEDEETNRQILEKYNFNYRLSAIIQRLSKIKIQTYREISTMARDLVVGQRFIQESIEEFLDSSQSSLKLQELYYHDIMSVASNRISPQLLNRILYLENETVSAAAQQKISDISSEQTHENYIHFKSNESSAMNNYVTSNEELEQISSFKLMKWNISQEQYSKQCENQNKKILDEFQKSKRLLKYSINDHYLNQSINKSITSQLQEFAKNQEEDFSADRTVRMGKQYKNRNQIMKMQLLLETLKQKNKHDQLMEKQMKKTQN